MTTVAERPVVAPAPEPARHPAGLVDWLTTADHKKIGILYMVTSFAFFLLAGAMAELMRIQLAQPDQAVVGRQTFNELFPMHGSRMLYLVLGRMAFVFAKSV